MISRTLVLQSVYFTVDSVLTIAGGSLSVGFAELAGTLIIDLDFLELDKREELLVLSGNLSGQFDNIEFNNEDECLEYSSQAIYENDKVTIVVEKEERCPDESLSIHRLWMSLLFAL